MSQKSRSEEAFYHHHHHQTSYHGFVPEAWFVEGADTSSPTNYLSVVQSQILHAGSAIAAAAIDLLWIMDRRHRESEEGSIPRRWRTSSRTDHPPPLDTLSIFLEMGSGMLYAATAISLMPVSCLCWIPLCWMPQMAKENSFFSTAVVLPEVLSCLMMP